LSEVLELDAARLAELASLGVLNRAR
jgi:hypothetical protein